MNIAEAIRTASGKLAGADVPEPVREAKLLIEFSTGRTGAFLVAHPEYELNQAEFARLDDAVDRRAGREPLQYIVGKQEFFGLGFKVTPAVLIPRPETEMVVHSAIEFLSGLDSPKFLDIGTGSGCISIAILKNVPDAAALAVDISEEAIAVASGNAAAHGVDGRLRLLRSDIYSEIGNEQFDLIVANPPYVPKKDLEGLQPEVRLHEPHSALTDGDDGLSIIKRIIDGAPQRLVPGGMMLIEIGYGQADPVLELVDRHSWRSAVLEDDFQRIPRMLAARFR